MWYLYVDSVSCNVYGRSTKEILGSFLFCIYLGSFTLPLHKGKLEQLNEKTIAPRNSLHSTTLTAEQNKKVPPFVRTKAM